MESELTVTQPVAVEAFLTRDATALAWGCRPDTFEWTAEGQRSAIASILFSALPAQSEFTSANKEHEA